MSAVTVGGDLIHYEMLGRGRSVVLLHGWVGSWRYWVPTMQSLHLKYRVYALDLLGFGDSAKNPRRYLPDEQIRMLLDFLESQQLRKVALIGHGLGAWLAAELARRAPEMVARMMLISTPLFPPANMGSRPVPTPISVPVVPPRAADPDKTIYNTNMEDFRRDAPLASLGSGRYDDASRANPRMVEPTDATIPNARLINRARLAEAARDAASRAVIQPLTEPNENNPLYRLLAGQEPPALLNRTVRRLDSHYEKLSQDVDRTDVRAIANAALYYNAGDTLDALRVLPMPVMLVHGDSDPLIPPPDEAVWNYLTQEKEDLCVPVPVPAGHFPMYEYNSFPRLLGGFLDAPDISKLEIKERWRRRSR